MTIDEAIRILTLCKGNNYDGPNQFQEQAHQIGIEALERLRALPLPGTSEGAVFLPE